LRPKRKPERRVVEGRDGRVVGEKVAFSQHRSAEGVTDYWAECLLCEWVVTSNATLRQAEEKFGRHYQAEHLNR
jgi:hypothetical protein